MSRAKPTYYPRPSCPSCGAKKLAMSFDDKVRYCTRCGAKIGYAGGWQTILSPATKDVPKINRSE